MHVHIYLHTPPRLQSLASTQPHMHDHTIFAIKLTVFNKLLKTGACFEAYSLSLMV